MAKRSKCAQSRITPGKRKRGKGGGPQRVTARKRGAAARYCPQCGGTDNSHSHGVRDPKTGVLCYSPRLCRPADCTHCGIQILVGHVQTAHSNCGLLDRSKTSIDHHATTTTVTPPTVRMTGPDGKRVPEAEETCEHCGENVVSIHNHYRVTGSINRRVRWMCESAEKKARKSAAAAAATDKAKAAASKPAAQPSRVPLSLPEGIWTGNGTTHWTCTTPGCRCTNNYTSDELCYRCGKSRRPKGNPPRQSSTYRW